MDELRQRQHENMVERLENDDISTGRGLNQETSLARPGATRWGSHYKTIVRLLSMWSSVVEVLQNIYEDGQESKSKGIVVGLIDKMETYEFVFIAHLMKVVLGLTNCLSQFLQQKDQNIVEAMSLVATTKRQLQDFRDNGWDNLLVDVNNFCSDSEHVISIPNMERAKVATASVERTFSAMNIVKTDLRNKIGDDFLTDYLVCYVERDVFMRIDN
jgi:hypothetical protein